MSEIEKNNKIIQKEKQKKGILLSIGEDSEVVLEDDLFYVDFKFSEPIKKLIELCLKDFTYEQKEGQIVKIFTLKYEAHLILEFFRQSQEDTKEQLHEKLLEGIDELTTNNLNIKRFFDPKNRNKYDLSFFPWFLEVLYSSKRNSLIISLNDRLLPFYCALREKRHEELFNLNMPNKKEARKLLTLKRRAQIKSSPKTKKSSKIQKKNPKKEKKKTNELESFL
jgi:hypothetical protein